MRHRVHRIVATFALLLALVALPVTTVRACSCTGGGPEERVGRADVLFIGVVIEEREPEQTAGFSEAVYIFDVERSIDPIVTPYGIAAWWGGDANCGFDMNVGERWVVFATLENGVPRTNLCQGTEPMPVRDPELRRVVEARVTERAEPGDGAGAIDRQPGPIPGMDVIEQPVAPEPKAATPAVDARLFFVGAAILVILAASALAFKRSNPD